MPDKQENQTQKENIRKILHAYIQEDVGDETLVTQAQIDAAADETMDAQGNPRGLLAILPKVKLDSATGRWTYTRDFELGDDKDAELDEEKIPHLTALFETLYRKKPHQFPSLFAKFLIRLYSRLTSKYPDQAAAQVQVLLLDRVLKGITKDDTALRSKLDSQIRREINPLPDLPASIPNASKRTQRMHALFQQLEENKTPFQILPTIENDPLWPFSALKKEAIWDLVLDFETMHTLYLKSAPKSSSVQRDNGVLFRTTFYALVFCGMDNKLDTTEFNQYAAFLRGKAHAEAKKDPAHNKEYAHIQFEFSNAHVSQFFDKHSRHSVGAAFIFGALITITATVLLGLSLTIGIPPAAIWAAVLGIIAASGAVYSTYYWINHRDIAQWDYFASALSHKKSNASLAKKHLVPEAKASQGIKEVLTSVNGIFLLLSIGLYAGLLIFGGPISAGIVGVNSFIYFGTNPGNSMITMALFASFVAVLSAVGMLFSAMGKLFSDYPGIQARFDTISKMITSSRKFNQPLIMVNALGIGTANAMMLSMTGIAAITTAYISVFAWMAIAISLIAYSSYQLYKGETHLNLAPSPKMLEGVPSIMRGKVENLLNMDLETLRMNAVIGLACTIVLAAAVLGLIANPFTSAATLGLMIVAGFAIGLFKEPMTKLMQRLSTETKHEKALREGTTPLMVLNQKNQPSPGPENKAAREPAKPGDKLNTPAAEKLPNPFAPTPAKKQAIRPTKH